MTIFALTSLLSFVVALVLGVFIYFKDTKSLINRLYFFVCMSIGLYSFIEFGYRQSRSFDEACFWWQLDIFWSIHIACWFHLAVAFTEKERWLKSRIFYALTYGPVVIFSMLDLFGNHITGPPVLQAWGWSYGVRNNLVSSLSYVWISVLPVIAAILYILYYKTLTDERKIKQTKLIIIGGLVPPLSQILELAIKAGEITFPPVVMLGFILLNVIIGLAIWKYELFTLTPSKAAESIIATMGDSLMLVGLDGAIISANHATTRMLGLTEKELVGKRIQHVFAPDAHIPIWIQERNGKKVDTFRSKDIETEYMADNGKIIPVSLSGSMLNDEEGNLRGFLLIARDITERKKAADEIVRHREHLEELVEERTQQLTQTNVQLKREINERQKAQNEKKELQDQLYQAQKMEAIGRLAGGVAHDFNNLLFVINGYSESLLDDLRDNKQAQEDLSQIIEAGKRAVNLTKQLLAFSRKQIIDPIILNVNERIEASYKMLSRLIGEDIQIDIRTNSHVGKIEMDVTQLDQIIANLVVNARDAMPKGGGVKLSTENVTIPETACVGFPERMPGKYILIRVRDTGCGINPDDMKKIFEPFFTSKEIGKGTGLGLATVYGIVKQNEGFIEVESTVNVGTEFRIYLPRVKQSGTSDYIFDDDIFTQRGSETILLVEDETLVRRLAKRQLESNGYTVIEATDGLNAKELFLKHEAEINLVLTDVIMPGMNGVDLIETLKKISPDLKVLFMSGHNDEIIDQHGIRKTQYPLLAKPFSVNQLCDKLRDVLDGLTSRIPPPPAPSL